MDLKEIMSYIRDAISYIDGSKIPFKAFKPGVGPYGEPQLLREIALFLNELDICERPIQTKRTPDLLIPDEWAIEFKIARPFGDNGKEAENWSVNLLHPYSGNISTIGDCYKLAQLPNTERKAVAVIGYEHVPAQIDLTPLIESFETITRYVVGINLSERIELRIDGLIHPVHQCARIFAWELIS